MYTDLEPVNLCRAGLPAEQLVPPVAKAHANEPVPCVCSALSMVPEEPSYQPRAPNWLSSNGSWNRIVPLPGMSLPGMEPPLPELDVLPLPELPVLPLPLL